MVTETAPERGVARSNNSTGYFLDLVRQVEADEGLRPDLPSSEEREEIRELRYQRATGKPSPRRIEDDRLLGPIRELHRRNYFAYDSTRMRKILLRAGEQVGRGRVERLIRSNGIQGAKRRGKPWRTTYPNVDAVRPADVVERDFTASRPDELWFADFTRLRGEAGPCGPDDAGSPLRIAIGCRGEPDS